MKTLTKMCTILCLGALASAASAIDYNSVFIEAEMNVIDPNNHQEEIFIGEEDLIIDFGLETFEFLNLNEGIISRSMNFNDPTASGLTLGFNTAFDADDCDQGDTPPCTEPFTLLGNYITSTGSGDNESSSFSAFTTTNREFFSFLSPNVETFGSGAFVADMGMGAAVEPPATLVLADIIGDYFVVSKWTGFRSDVNYSGEFSGLSLVDFNFNGSGGCSGSVVDSEMEQSNSWPDLGTRTSVGVGTGADVFTACSYTVNAGNGTVTVTLTTNNEGEDEVDVVTFFVSSGYRYLVTQRSGTEIDGTETYYEGSVIVAVKQASGASNSSLSGTYLTAEHQQGQSVTASGTGGVESDSLLRSVIVFNADTPDGSGYSTCDVTSTVYALAYRAMGGSVDFNTDYQVKDILNESLDVDHCRYKVAGDGIVQLETSLDGVNWRVRDVALSSDQQGLVGGSFDTDADPLAPNTITFLSSGEAATSIMFVAVKLNAGPDTQAVLDDYARLMLPGDGGTPDDFDNDGDSDVLLRNTSGPWRLFNMQGLAVASNSGIGLFSGSNWTHQGNADFDADGDADVLLRRDDGSWRVFEIENGALNSSALMNLFLSSSWEYKGAYDFDQDGDADILCRKSDTKQWRLFEVQDLQVVSSAEVFMYQNGLWVFQDIKDYDGDGDGDVLLRRTDNGKWRVFEFENRGLTGNGDPGLFNSLVWTYQGAGDMDKDDVADIVLRNSTGDWRIFDMQGRASSGVSVLNVFTNTDWQSSQVGDYDADGDADLLLRRTSDGAWRLFEIENRSVQGNSQANIWPNTAFQVQQ